MPLIYGFTNIPSWHTGKKPTGPYNGYQKNQGTRQYIACVMALLGNKEGKLAFLGQHVLDSSSKALLSC